ncbi:AAA family ATPase [Alphaproteobacteria bacterium]|nr:AAA family ATPase [Alphaproteobacteria bacterium]
MSPPLKGLQLSNYRNFINRKEVFKSEHTLFKGKNAVGKTNILEAISFLCPGTGFRKDGIQNFIFQKQEKLKSSITFNFENEDLENQLTIELSNKDERWSKRYFLNDKKIQQQKLLDIFQLFWFTEIDKVYFIKDTQYQRNTINRIICYFEPKLFSLLNQYTKLRREKKRILQSSQDNSWLISIDKQLFDIGKSIIEIKIEFLKEFQNFLSDDSKKFFDFEIIPSFGLSEKENFLEKFQRGLSDESQWPNDHKLQSDHDPKKSIFEITNNQKNISQLSSAQSKMLILSLLLSCAKFLNRNRITIFLIDEIFDNFDMVNINKVIEYCAENKFQTFFSTTDNFTLKGNIDNLEIKEIL